MVFIDPVSLNIFNIVHFNPSDFRLTSSINKIISVICPKLEEMIHQKGLDFEKMFEGKIIEK